MGAAEMGLDFNGFFKKFIGADVIEWCIEEYVANGRILPEKYDYKCLLNFSKD